MKSLSIKPTATRFSAIATAVVTLVWCAATACADTTVSTLSGSGSTGYGDGSAREASFMMPMGIANGLDGDVYVADAAAQRIRVVDREGTVRTLAGSGTPDASGVWVPGGYADGAAAQSRFNRPAAVAVGADARVYVADSYNHCIRVISTDRVVSTFAGQCGHSGLQIGNRTVALFWMPAGLAFDRAQNLYVVDTALAGAIRKIAADGTVTNVPMPGVQPTGGIAIVETATGMTVALTAIWGLYIHHSDGSTTVLRNDYYSGLCRAGTAPPWVLCQLPAQRLREYRDVGDPAGVAALNDHHFIYTDYRTGALRSVDLQTLTGRRIAGSALEDGSGRGSGYVDGDATSARFNAPFGLALRPNGDVVVAELATRRLRLVSDPGLREPLAASGSPLSLPPSGGRPTALYVGSATIWQGTTWADSLPGRLEARLGSRRCAGCPEPAVVPVVFDRLDAGIRSLAALPPHAVDDIVIQLSMADVARLAGLDSAEAAKKPSVWRALLDAQLRRASNAAAASGSRLLVVLAPEPFDVGPAAMVWERASENTLAQGGTFALLKSAVAASGVAYVSTLEAFRAASASFAPPALFSTAGEEFASGGRDLLAQAAAQAFAGVHH